MWGQAFSLPPGFRPARRGYVARRDFSTEPIPTTAQNHSFVCCREAAENVRDYFFDSSNSPEPPMPNLRPSGNSMLCELARREPSFA